VKRHVREDDSTRSRAGHGDIAISVAGSWEEWAVGVTIHRSL
jgi:hypothetical protein